jgi:hypothetical protein
MIFRPIFRCALRLVSGAAIALFFTLALSVAVSYMVGGWAPATILGVFLCASFEALLPLVGVLFCALLGVQLARQPIRAMRP